MKTSPSCHLCASPALCTWHWHFCASRRTESRWEPWWLLERFLGLFVCKGFFFFFKSGYVSLSSRCRCWTPLCVRAAWALLGCLINTAAAAPLLSAHPPTRRDRAFPGTAHFLTRGRGCRCPQAARCGAIGAPKMITRMLQPSISISRLVSGDLGGRAEQTVTTQEEFFFFFFFFFPSPSSTSFSQTDRTEQNRTTRHAAKRTLLAAQTAPRQPLMSSDDFWCTFCGW